AFFNLRCFLSAFFLFLSFMSSSSFTLSTRCRCCASRAKEVREHHPDKRHLRFSSLARSAYHLGITGLVHAWPHAPMRFSKNLHISKRSYQMKRILPLGAASLLIVSGMAFGAEEARGAETFNFQKI